MIDRNFEALILIDDILCQVSLRYDFNFTRNYLEQKP